MIKFITHIIIRLDYVSKMQMLLHLLNDTIGRAYVVTQKEKENLEDFDSYTFFISTPIIHKLDMTIFDI